jgi:hypothetical protein
MRFNSRELALLAQQVANVDKEGVLYMKEKQDSIFRKSEGIDTDSSSFLPSCPLPRPLTHTRIHASYQSCTQISLFVRNKNMGDIVQPNFVYK